MNYTINYDIHSIRYDGHTTRVIIVNHDTGEVFTGTARRHPSDRTDIRIGANLALSRAIRKMMDTDMHDWQIAIEDGCGGMI